MILGILTYDYFHLKTEQLVCKYIYDNRVKKINLYALPFIKRPKRKVIFSHRPDQSKGVHTKNLETLNKVSFINWDGEKNIGLDCDVFIIAGAGILNIDFAQGKPIINAHPGIIPTTRGLDAFKWAILNGDPLGITLHLIDNEIDKGEIIEIKNTPVFSTDSLQTLSRRHYELEISMLESVIHLLDKRFNPSGIEKKSTLRMNNSLEKEMIKNFNVWKEKFI